MKTVYKFLLGSLIIFITLNASAKEIKGIVCNENGKPVEGAMIFARGAEYCSMTNENGEFFIDVPDSVNSIVCDYPGMQKASSDIGNSTYLDIIVVPLNSDKIYNLSIEDLLCVRLNNY